MSSKNVAVSVRGLSKAYTIAHNAPKHTMVGEALAHRLKNPRARVEKETFWALRDVEFDVFKGDVVGIIGRNGAGKSTLLKILSRISKPTKGQIDLYGRVGSLLEVGTGFHPELTGRENIFLNGAILGMRRREIERQFDAIVSFAEVAQFLDTPVKRYSSGMYVRLAFAVAAHLNPEILIVDEVLAVGDAEFQKKCLGKMQDVAQSGRTVLFVSHSMAAVSNLCSSAIVLVEGRLAFQGTTDEAIAFYSASTKENHLETSRDINRHRPSWARPLITSARLLDEHGQVSSALPLGSPVTFEMTFATPEDAPLRSPVMGVVINHATLGTVGGVNTRMTGIQVDGNAYPCGTMRCHIEDFPLLQGQYTVDIWLGDGVSNLDCLNNFIEFTIEENDVYRTGQAPYAHMGTVFFRPQWSITRR